MWPLENTASLCRTLTPFLISVSNNMLTFQRRSKCSSADQQQGWCEESLIVTSPWTRRQRERGSVISGERKALTRLGSRGQRLHMELMSCQVVLSWPDYETADVYTHTETDSHQTCGGCEDVCHVILVVLFLFLYIFSLYADDSLFSLTVLCLFVVTLRLVVAALCLHVVIF